MTIGHVLLGLLAPRRHHGYELKQQYDLRFPAARPLPFGQVYTALDSLRRRELVEAVGTEKAGAAERTIFAITTAGRVELDRWLHEVDPPRPNSPSSLQTKVTLALLAAGEDVAGDYLRAQRAAHMAGMRQYTRLVNDPGSSLATVLAADYALTHLDADLRWIDAATTRIHDLAKELSR